MAASTDSAGTRIIALWREFVPLGSLDALVAEEDTGLMLSAEASLEAVAETHESLIRQALRAPARPPGSVVVEDGSPLRLFAVVYDFEREPPCREAWLGLALANVFAEAERRRVQTMALPMLGTLSGCLKRRRFAPLLRRALARARPRHLRTLWLIMPASSNQGLLQALGVLARVRA